MLLTPFRPKVFEPERGLSSAPSLVLQGLHRSKELLEAVNEHGLVLLRGFPRATNPLHFSAFVQSLSLIPFDGSESAAPRTEVAPYVFTANEAPPSEVIPFHHEMAQCAKAPDLVFFFCQRPARSGGATPVMRSRDVAEFVMRRHPAAARELETRGIRYARTLPEHDDPSSPIGRSWRRTYGATIDEAEEGLLQADVEGTWTSSHDGERLLRTLSAPRPFFGRDAEGRRTFFQLGRRGARWVEGCEKRSPQGDCLRGRQQSSVGGGRSTPPRRGWVHGGVCVAWAVACGGCTRAGQPPSLACTGNLSRISEGHGILVESGGRELRRVHIFFPKNLYIRTPLTFTLDETF